MREIRIDDNEAGEWIMDRTGGDRFVPGYDRSFSLHDEKGNVVGGFVIGQYFGNSMLLYVASLPPKYCPKELLWMVHHYAFIQCGCYKLIGIVRSDNHRLLTIGLRTGWKLEATIEGMFASKVHGMILTMTRETCPWLDYQPKNWKPGPTRKTDGFFAAATT